MSNIDERYLLIGGKGFIGKNIQNSFNQQDVVFKCVGSELSNNNFHYALHAAVNVFSPTRIVFLAAKVGSMASIRDNPFEFIMENSKIFIETFSVLKRCVDEGHKFQILNIISNCVYPAISDYQSEQDIFQGVPHSSVEPFAQAKRLLIALGNNFSISHDIELLNLVLANSFGPYDHLDSARSHALTGMIVRMIKAKQLGNKTFDVWGTGAPIRSWLYAPDFADQVIRIFNERAMWKQKILNYPPSVQNLSIKELALQIAREVGFEGEINFDTSKGDGDPIKILKSNKFEKIFKPEMTDFSEALRETVLYFKDKV